jgi:hypothetical protein
LDPEFDRFALAAQRQGASAMNRILMSLVFAMSLSCGDTTVTGKDFSTSCTVDADCVAVFLGNVCAQCTCPTTAISRSSKNAYDTEYAAAVKGCGGTPVNTCSCLEVTAHCASGTCTIPAP